ncbi:MULTISPECIES: hypothetical protein [unclassified Enterococcus]|uniref:hypothetical protein n=1 Tax=unclassified Enterococcus TaxID=2608891 RepID=UPI00259B1C15|nr:MULTISPECIES: hypothetical protein [unclassified Enterococcus]MDO0920126.1 hypothetical protein [Enterococcus sp. B1E2]WIV14632.1 hypothetical protein QN079_11755 [Enterococcus sp. FZMF]
MLKETARIALHGMNSNDEEVMKACLEKIWIMCIENVSESEASKKMNDNQKDKIKADDDQGAYLIKKYGTYKGHSKFKLALDFFQMSNDRFFEIYKFNFVPRGELYEVARSYITGRQLSKGLIAGTSISANMLSRSVMEIDISSSIANQIRNSMNKSFRLGR